jgi:hypothetical protein
MQYIYDYICTHPIMINHDRNMASNVWMVNEWALGLGFGRKWTLPNLRYYPDICLEGLSKPTGETSWIRRKAHSATMLGDFQLMVTIWTKGKQKLNIVACRLVARQWPRNKRDKQPLLGSHQSSNGLAEYRSRGNPNGHERSNGTATENCVFYSVRAKGL